MLAALLCAASGTALAQDVEPKDGGTAIFAVSNNPAHLNGAISTNPEIQRTAMALLEGLTYVGGDMQPKPELAESWDISDDGKTYTFHLRQNVTWHDGTPFTSADVKFAIEQLAPLKSTGKALQEMIEAVETPDDHTVVVNLKQPFPSILVIMSDDSVPILPAHLYEGTNISDNPHNLAPVGTGPFKFASMTPGAQVELERNEDYWGGRPHLERLIFTVVPDAGSRLTSYQSGGVDYLFGSFVDLGMVSQFGAVPDTEVNAARNLPANMVLIFNTERKPFDDKLVRQALFQGLDRELMVAAAYDGQAQVSASIIPRALQPFYSAETDYSEIYPFSTEAARQALEAAGAADLTVNISFRPDLASAPQIADVMKSNWEQMGVTVNLRPEELAVWRETVFTKKDFDVTLLSYGSYGDPVLGIQRVYVCVADDPQMTYTNPSGYCNPEVDAMFFDAATRSSPADRAIPYAEVQKVLADDLPSVPLADNSKLDVGNSARLGGLDEFFQSWDFSVLWAR
ncbi:ABC transporter substrate-binding protein [Devosia sp. 2618]|uniref:ABC transporter substrate-binding protein n=1 Tax=Devosia sp. 2618 TaxID=3156454 RepID=UPI00339465FA